MFLQPRYILSPALAKNSVGLNLDFTIHQDALYAVNDRDQCLTFFLIYAFDDFRSFSTSPARSRLISAEQIAPIVHNAKLTTYCVW